VLLAAGLEVVVQVGGAERAGALVEARVTRSKSARLRALAKIPPVGTRVEVTASTCWTKTTAGPSCTPSHLTGRRSETGIRNDRLGYAEVI